MPARSTAPDIPTRERLIVALDLPDHEAAHRLVARLGDSVHFYKVGLELFLAGSHHAFISRLRESGKRVFIDLKLFDVPETVAAAVRQLRGSGADFATVHGNDGMLRAACREKGDLKILAVTALTSLDRGDLEDLGFRVSVSELVLSRARRALEAGCDGVIASGLEAEALRSEFGRHYLVVTPGIRPVENARTDDQKRIMAPRRAFLAGADYIVVGRPIRDASDPRAAAERMQHEIAELFSGR